MCLVRPERLSLINGVPHVAKCVFEPLLLQLQVMDFPNSASPSVNLPFS